MAGCAPRENPAALRHPTLGFDEQARVRARCEMGAREILGTPPPPAPVRPCPDDGDPTVRDRCRANADLALMAQTRYIDRLDAEIAGCLRRAGFRE